MLTFIVIYFGIGFVFAGGLTWASHYSTHESFNGFSHVERLAYFFLWPIEFFEEIAEDRKTK